MDHSVLLARLFGLYLIVIGLFWIIKRELLVRVWEDLVNSPAMMVVGSSVALLTGIFILLIHPVLSLNWRGALTLLFGCLPIVKGVIGLFVADAQAICIKWCLHGKGPYYVGGVLLLLGLFFSYHGFALALGQ